MESLGVQWGREGRMGGKKPPTEKRGRIRFRIWGFVSHKMMFQQREGEREGEGVRAREECAAAAV